MKIAVLGAGVVGVTTAHFLSAAGHDVTVVDRATDVATQCSHANGAQLSYSYTDAIARPSFLLRLPGIVAGRYDGFRIRPPADRGSARWALSFLMQCTQSRADANTRSNLELAVRSAQLIRSLRSDLPADFHFRESGRLVLLSRDQEVENARRAGEIKAELGVRARVITIDEACEREPEIARMKVRYKAAVWTPGDDVGDAAEFTRLLARQLRNRGRATFLLDTEVTGLIRRRDSVRGVETDRGTIEADAVVVCLGAWSRELLRSVGVAARIAPLRGYSVTLPPGPSKPAISITDFARRFVFTRLGDKMRIAGFADFVGFDADRDEERVAKLLSVARQVAPEIADFGHPQVHAWAGSRPLTPDGRPLVGRTGLDGLFLNTGHGALGWTLACATAERLAEELTAPVSGN